ncbi:MAG: carboxypeptidase-like regulatory domain-containing protein, partial [Bacteroidaceae bacterium]|nr:carboxypeptidase-like regulatory domain-containing protein [Bacteroidaceae bacterium]
MRFSKCFLLAAAMILSLGSFAQNGRKDAGGTAHTISGRIYDADNGSPLELVNIVFENNAYWAVSDLDGRFSLKMKDGDYH